MARQPLGRGLSALMGEESETSPEASSLEIDVDLIDANPEQPRTRFAEAALDELAQSIRSNGIVQPIVVRKRGTRYQIVAGERRWRAAQRAELRRVPVVVKEVSDDKLLEIALIENIQRQDLNPIEEAKAYRKLIEKIGLTQENIAERIGKSRTVVATATRLLKLPLEIQKQIETGTISAGHGRALLTTEDPAIQKAVATSIADFNLSVRATENAIRRLTRQSSQTQENKAVTRTTDSNEKQAEIKLQRALNTNVKIFPSKTGSGGKIEIEYYGIDDLDRIFQTIRGKANDSLA